MSAKAIRMISKLLSSKFTANDISHVAREIDRHFDIYEISGYPKHHNMFANEAADIAVKYLYETKKFRELVNFLLNLHGTIYRGKEILIENINEIKSVVENVGLEYDNKKELVLFSQKNGLRTDFGDCIEGKEYEFSFVRIQVMGLETKTHKYDINIIYKTYSKVIDYLREKIEARDGRLWSWYNGSALAAFYGNNKRKNALYSSLEILQGVHIFNAEENETADEIMFKIGIHNGDCVYLNQTENILSSSINFVSHLQEQKTPLNSICISESIMLSQHEGIRKLFTSEGVFEGTKIYSLILKVNI